MLSKRRKFKNRKSAKKKIRIAICAGIALVVVIGAAYPIMQKNTKSRYISPLAAGVLPLTLPHKDEKLVSLKTLLVEKHIMYSSVAASSGDYTITLQDGPQIVFSGEKDFSAQISSLQFILTRLTMLSKPYKRLDLRFDKPVISYE